MKGVSVLKEELEVRGVRVLPVWIGWRWVAVAQGTRILLRRIYDPTGGAGSGGTLAVFFLGFARSHGPRGNAYRSAPAE